MSGVWPRSGKSREDNVWHGIDKAAGTVREIRGIDIAAKEAIVEDGNIARDRIDARIPFQLERRAPRQRMTARREDKVIKKVLIATDGSEHARKAVDFGSDIAAKYGAEVVLVHVLLRDELSENLRHMAEVEYHAGETGGSLAEAIAMIPEGRFPAASLQPKNAQTPGAALRAVAEQVLGEAERRAKEHGVKKVSRQIEDGDAVKRILEVAKDTQADLIVTGTRGLSDFKALLAGSVSHKLMQVAPVTCISVR